jgi:Secretion system C-terminal sorting domain
MRITIITMLMFLHYISMYGQLSIQPDSLAFCSIDSKNFQNIRLTIINNENTQQKIWWKVIRGNPFPSAWELFFSDLNREYNSNILKCPQSSPNIISPNDTAIFVLNILPNELKGIGNVWVELYNDKMFTNLVATTHQNGTIKIGGLTSEVETVYFSDIKVFPNPFTQELNIVSIVPLTYILIYDVMGKMVENITYLKDEVLKLGSLPQGIYLLKAYSDSNSTVLIRKIIKL